jgi:hypothetical protein
MAADDVDLDSLLALETKVWEALQRGDAEQDRALLSADFIGVYPSGFADRAGTHNRCSTVRRWPRSSFTTRA